jgi:hypothetical protein
VLSNKLKELLGLRQTERILKRSLLREALRRPPDTLRLKTNKNAKNPVEMRVLLKTLPLECDI